MVNSNFNNCWRIPYRPPVACLFCPPPPPPLHPFPSSSSSSSHQCPWFCLRLSLLSSSFFSFFFWISKKGKGEGGIRGKEGPPDGRRRRIDLEGEREKRPKLDAWAWGKETLKIEEVHKGQNTWTKILNCLKSLKYRFGTGKFFFFIFPAILFSLQAVSRGAACLYPLFSLPLPSSLSAHLSSRSWV